MFGKKDDWQGKYKSLVRESEQCEKQLASANAQLRSLSAQLDLATHGQSPTLDVLLDKLKTALEAGRTDVVQDLLRKTEKQVRKLEEPRARFATALIKQLRDWSGQLVLQDTQDHYGEVLDAARMRLDDHATDLHQLPEVASTLLGVQKKLNTLTVTRDDDNDLSHTGSVIGSRLATRMLELLQQLNVPPKYAERAHTLIQRLEASPDADGLETCLKDLSELMRVSGGNLETDIQNYLMDLNDQLAYLRSFVDSTETLELKQRKRNNLLDQTVRQDVGKIHHTVENTHDINELKRSVSAQLSGILQAMSQHKMSEDEHVKALQQEKSALVSRLSEMEQRAEMFRIRAEDAHLESRTDPLTGLPNRLAYDQKFAEEIERFQRYGTAFSLCVGDLDHFKRINDQYGHLAGDKVLRLTSKVLFNNLRGVDFVARFGGEEFVILMPSTTGENARLAADKICKAVEQSPFNFQGDPVQVTLSLGGAEIREGDTAETLFNRADAAVYEAKRAGRNCVRFGD